MAKIKLPYTLIMYMVVILTAAGVNLGIFVGVLYPIKHVFNL